jgi:ABC-2 type transport system ATP-binding protein
LEEAERLCERIAIINKGKILLNEKTEKILKDNKDKKNLEEIFINLTSNDIQS